MKHFNWTYLLVQELMLSQFIPRWCSRTQVSRCCLQLKLKFNPNLPISTPKIRSLLLFVLTLKYNVCKACTQSVWMDDFSDEQWLIAPILLGKGFLNAFLVLLIWPVAYLAFFLLQNEIELLIFHSQLVKDSSMKLDSIFRPWKIRITSATVI